MTDEAAVLIFFLIFGPLIGLIWLTIWLRYIRGFANTTLGDDSPTDPDSSSADRRDTF